MCPEAILSLGASRLFHKTEFHGGAHRRMLFTDVGGSCSLQDSKPKANSLVAWHVRVRRRGARSNHFCERASLIPPVAKVIGPLAAAGLSAASR